MKFLFFFLLSFLTASLSAQMFITDQKLVFGTEQTDTLKIMYLEKDSLLEGTLYRKYRVCIFDKSKHFEGERFKVDDIAVDKNGKLIKSLFIVKRNRLISSEVSATGFHFSN